jgi:hypothetical protein
MSTTKNDNNLVKEANLLLNNLENISKKHHPCAPSNPKQNMAWKGAMVVPMPIGA